METLLKVKDYLIGHADTRVGPLNEPRGKRNRGPLILVSALLICFASVMPLQSFAQSVCWNETGWGYSGAGGGSGPCPASSSVDGCLQNAIIALDSLNSTITYALVPDCQVNGSQQPTHDLSECSAVSNNGGWIAIGSYDAQTPCASWVKATPVTNCETCSNNAPVDPIN